MQENEHKDNVLVQHFAGLSDYWRSIYVDEPKSWDFFHHHAVIKRKIAVLDFVKQIANGNGNGNAHKILDAGCGAGMIMAELLRQGHKVRGLELSGEMMDTARMYLLNCGFPDADIALGSIENSRIDDAVFDISLCIGVLQYLDDDEKALRELSRITKKNGFIIISLPNILRLKNLLDPFYSIRRAPYFLWLKIIKQGKYDCPPTSYDIQMNRTFRNRRYFHGQLEKLFIKYGLEISGVRAIGYGPLTFWQKEYLPREFILKISRWLERLAMYKPFFWLTFLADRWVLLLKRTH